MEQSLTQAQRRALVEGEVLQGHKGGRMVIRHGGKTVTIEPQRIVAIPNPEMFGDVGYRVNELARGFQRKSVEARRKPAPKAAAAPRPAPAAVNAAPAPNPPASTVPTSRTGVEGRALGNTTAAPANRGSTVTPPATPSSTPTPTRPAPTQPAPSRPVPAQPALNPSSVKMEVTAPLANVLARQQALAGGAMELYARQLANMREDAEAQAEEAVRRLEPEIDGHRMRGRWVLVRVSFAVPITQDVFGMEGDSYPIFWNASYSSAELVTQTPNGPPGPQYQASMLMNDLRAHQEYYGTQKHRGVQREVPPGRKLVSQEYRLYSPFPKLPSGDPQDPLRAWMEVHAPDKLRWLGQARCTR